MMNRLFIQAIIFGMTLSLSVLVTFAEVPVKVKQTGIDNKISTAVKQNGKKAQPEAKKSPAEAQNVEPETKQNKSEPAGNNQAKKPNKEAPGAFPFFMVKNTADASSVDAPGSINYTIVVKNTGNTPLTDIRISGAIPKPLSGPSGDAGKPGSLDVDETWTFTGTYAVTQETIDGNGVNDQNTIDNDGDIDSVITVAFSENTQPQTAVSSVSVIRKPLFKATKVADVTSINEPATINYTITLENTGNVSLTGIRISDPVPGTLSGPEGDAQHPGVLDVDEVWKYTGSFTATKTVFEGKGLDSNRVPDGDSDIDSTVIVDFIETDPPQTAYAGVKTEPFIGGEIFEKNRRYVHGFLSGARIYTSNLYKTDNNPESCWATFLTPGIWAAVPSTPKRSVEIITANASPGGLAMSSFNPEDRRPYQAYLLYSPQLEIYHDQNINAYQDPDIDENIHELTGQDSLDRLTHRVDAFLHYHSGNKLSLGAMDQYKIGYDAFSERAYTTDDKYNTNLFNVTSTFDATPKSQLRLDYSNFNLDYKDTINSDSDRLDNAIAAFLFFRMTAKTSAFVEYDFADINYDTSEKDSHEHRYFAGVRWQMTGKSSGLIKGGFGEKKSDTSSVIPDTDQNISDISENEWMAEIQIDHNLNSRTNLTFNAYRRYDETLEHRYDYGDFEDFYADYILAHFAGLSLKRDITKKIHLLMDTSIFYDEFNGSRQDSGSEDLEEREDTKFAVSPSISYDVYDWMTINGAYIYTDQESNYSGNDYIDHTFFVRLNLSL